jgi:hypothetical protein
MNWRNDFSLTLTRICETWAVLDWLILNSSWLDLPVGRSACVANSVYTGNRIPLPGGRVNTSCEILLPTHGQEIVLERRHLGPLLQSPNIFNVLSPWVSKSNITLLSFVLNFYQRIIWTCYTYWIEPSSMSANRAKIVFVCKHLQKKLTSFIPHSRIWRWVWELMMLKMNRLRNLDKTYMFMLGGLAVVVGTILYIVVSQHGPAICANALRCG